MTAISRIGEVAGSAETFEIVPNNTVPPILQHVHLTNSPTQVTHHGTGQSAHEEAPTTTGISQEGS